MKRPRTLTTDAVNQTLSSPSTHRLVYQVLELTKRVDIVDAMHDLELVVEILKSRFWGGIDESL